MHRETVVDVGVHVGTATPLEFVPYEMAGEWRAAVKMANHLTLYFEAQEDLEATARQFMIFAERARNPGPDEDVATSAEEAQP